jgi:uracil-DNA glycosylase family 4
MYDELVKRVQRCRRCPAMAGRRRVLGEGNGSPDSRVMFVGEAPGRLGGDRTGIPFSGDQSGLRFERLLTAAGWARAEVFVTNAVLCNPRDPQGRNRPPSRTELAACGAHLKATRKAVSPELLVAVGRRAVQALGLTEVLRDAEPGERRAHQGAQVAWVVHPSPLTQTRRSWDQQIADWQRLARGQY